MGGPGRVLLSPQTLSIGLFSTKTIVLELLFILFALSIAVVILSTVSAPCKYGSIAILELEESDSARYSIRVGTSFIPCRK
jgi:hypothetical protein